MDRTINEKLKHGCGDHSCLIATPKGQGTNGGCRCDDIRVFKIIVRRLKGEITQLREQQWNCPACGFTCERIHVEDQPDEEKCPACNEQRLREQLKAKDLGVEGYRHTAEVAADELRKAEVELAAKDEEIKRLTAVMHGEPKWNDSEWSERWQRGKEAGLAAKDQELAAIQHGLKVEFLGGTSGDILDDFGTFIEHHKDRELQITQLREQIAELERKFKQVIAPAEVGGGFVGVLQAELAAKDARIRQAKP